MSAAVLVDTGFLVALGVRRDPRHAAAVAWLTANRAALLIPAPVIVEACYFLSMAAKSHLLSWARRPPARVLEVPAEAYPEIALTLEKYADRDPDFTDAALVWAAHDSGCRRILTVDRTDFEAYRLKGNKRFDVLPWANG
jgi:predicted nucleic acid-binding protein